MIVFPAVLVASHLYVLNIFVCIHTHIFETIVWSKVSAYFDKKQFQMFIRISGKLVVAISQRHGLGSMWRPFR